MTKTPSTPPNRKQLLPCGDPKQFLEMLQSGEHEKELFCRAQAGLYPHIVAIDQFAMARTAVKRQAWLECIRIMVSKRAPYADDNEPGVLLDALVEIEWDVAPDVASELVRLYVETGELRPDTLVPGELCPLDDLIFGVSGMTAMAAAITQDRHHMLQVLLDAGADVSDIGPVQEDGPHWSAMDHAREMRASKCQAVLAAHVMRTVIAAPADAPDSSPARRSRATL